MMEVWGAHDHNWCCTHSPTPCRICLRTPGLATGALWSLQVTSASHWAHVTDMRVWSCHGEHSAAYNILQYDQFGCGSVMVWGGLSFAILARGILTATGYRHEILRPIVGPCLAAGGPGFLQMQDNARPHGRSVSAAPARWRHRYWGLAWIQSSTSGTSCLVPPTTDGLMPWSRSGRSSLRRTFVILSGACPDIAGSVYRQAEATDYWTSLWIVLRTFLRWWVSHWSDLSTFIRAWLWIQTSMG